MEIKRDTKEGWFSKTRRIYTRLDDEQIERAAIGLGRLNILFMIQACTSTVTARLIEAEARISRGRLRDDPYASDLARA
ncbi:hypothetical protein Tco_0008143 [Tanacetum coccineum]